MGDTVIQVKTTERYDWDLTSKIQEYYDLENGVDDLSNELEADLKMYEHMLNSIFRSNVYKPPLNAERIYIIYQLGENIRQCEIEDRREKTKSPNEIEKQQRDIECKKLDLMKVEVEILEHTPQTQAEAQEKLFFVCQLVLKNHDFDVDFFAAVAAECLVFMNGMRSKDSTRRCGKAEPGALSTSLGENGRAIDRPSSASLKPISETLTELEPYAPGSAPVT